MRLPTPPPATRFWAKPLAGWLECPRCGKVIYFQTSKGRTKQNAEWDPRTSRLQCPECKLVLVLGLLAWPVKPGQARTAPRDQVPQERQLAQLRAQGAGWWLPQSQAKQGYRPDDTNVTAACTCPEGAEGGDDQCPVHGIAPVDEQVNEDPWPR
jgi:hypothetical protein